MVQTPNAQGHRQDNDSLTHGITMRDETKEILQHITDVFTGADGGVAYVSPDRRYGHASSRW